LINVSSHYRESHLDADQLTLREMTFEGIPYDDDWLVIWRGLAVGRILKQSGGAYGNRIGFGRSRTAAL